MRTRVNLNMVRFFRKAIVLLVALAVVLPHIGNAKAGPKTGLPTPHAVSHAWLAPFVVVFQDRERATRATIKTIETALKIQHLDTGTWPTIEQGIETLVEQPDDAKLARKWRGPYLEQLPKDSWQHTFSYRLIEETPDQVATPVIWSWGPDGKNNTADDIGTWQETPLRKGSADGQSSLPTTWKQLGLDSVPDNYPTDGISLINGLNQTRGSWTFNGARLESDETRPLVGRLTSDGSFKNALALEKFPSWQFGLEWSEGEKTKRTRLLVTVMPSPSGMEMMLVRPPVTPPRTDTRPRPTMFRGNWDPKSRTISWTLFDKLPFGEPESEPEEDSKKSLESFEMVFPVEGGVVLQNFESPSAEEAVRIMGRTQNPIGEPYVEKELKITQLPNGYQVFFASNSEVYLMDQTDDIIAGARVNQLGIQGDLIFGEVTEYRDNDSEAAALGFFWVNSKTGKIQRGLDVDSWRAKLKEQGVEKSDLSPVESYGPRF